jgi:YidC/Oxa1 family membrane protein insertase
MKSQQRFIFALVASAAVLIGWNYMFPPVPPPPPNANANINANQQVAQASPQSTAQASAQVSPSPTPQPAATATPSSVLPAASPTPTPEVVPQRKIRVVTPLYEATFDTRGAVATSWIVKQVKRSDGTLRKIYGEGSTSDNPKPLELVTKRPESVAAEKTFQPFQIVTGDAAVDTLLSGSNFKVSAPIAESGDATLDVTNSRQSLIFTMNDAATGTDVTKEVTFLPDRYLTEVKLKIARQNQALPQAKLALGPSIGDQGIAYYGFYLYPPEGLALINGEARRIPSLEVHSDRRNTGTINWMLEGIGLKSPVPKPVDQEMIDGQVQWAGVDDTYFGMVGVLTKPATGLEYRTAVYEHKYDGNTEQRFLVTGLLPVPTDGSKTDIYIGPKDHRLLDEASAQVRQAGGPQVDLGEVINYGFLGGMRRALAIPILWAIEKLQRMTGSYGVAIILFTVFIYSLFMPLKWVSSKKMKKAQKYAPRMKELQEKLKGMKQTDPRLKELQMEQLRLMKEANPLGGCLPLLIQMPFLFALYTALTISIDFRQASFLWIPDLSAPEPYLLGFIRTLPVLFTASMIVLQLLTPAPSADPLQRKMMAIGMPLFMLYILWSAPSGLLLYWLVGNVVGFLQQMLINRLTKEPEEPPKDEKTAKKNKPKKLKPAEA